MLHVQAVPLASGSEVLDFLLADCSPEARRQIAAMLPDVPAAGQGRVQLLAARRTGRLVGAVLATLRSPRVAHVFAPRLD